MGVKVRKPDGYSAWCVVIDHKGQRKTIAVGSREAAERVLREEEVRLALGGRELLEHQTTALPTLAEYSKEWLAHVGQERKPSTAGFYGQFLRLYVCGDSAPAALSAPRTTATQTNVASGIKPSRSDAVSLLRERCVRPKGVPVALNVYE